MIFRRAIVNEIANSAGAVFSVLFCIVFTQVLVHMLGDAASGDVDTKALFSIVALSTLTNLPLVLTLSVFISVLIALSRAFRDSEMVVWFASGVGITRFIRPVLVFATPLATLVALMSLVVSPWALQERSIYQSRLDSRDDVSQISPGSFRESRTTDQVFFVDALSDARTQVRNVFVQSLQSGKLGVTVADHGYVRTAPNGDRFMVLINGRRYEGTPGSPDYNYTDFDQAELRIEQREAKESELSTKTRSVAQILEKPTLDNLAELHWRIGLPVSMLVLSLIAIPLSYVNTRSGRGANLVTAILCYMLYYNVMSIEQAWTAAGRLPAAVGLWPVHLLFFAAFLLLIGWRTRFGGVFRRRR